MQKAGSKPVGRSAGHLQSPESQHQHTQGCVWVWLGEAMFPASLAKNNLSLKCEERTRAHHLERKTVTLGLGSQESEIAAYDCNRSALCRLLWFLFLLFCMFISVALLEATVPTHFQWALSLPPHTILST